MSLAKLRYKVISFSSEDPDYPASQLNTVSPSTRGWQSVRFCSYPQELGFEVLDGETQIAQLQLLSHQSKISSKVEIFIGQGSSYATAKFSRLGYLSLDSNERSSFQARELKTVYIDNMFGSYIKLLISENHVNKQNIYNQVGIIAVSLMGIAEEDMAAPKGGRISPGHKGGPINNYNDLSIDLNLDPQTASKLRQLADAKTRAVDAEDYLTAKKIKAVEQELKAMGSKLAQLDMAKSDAVMAEDYDSAKEIKDQCDALRREIEAKINHISIPGVSLTKSPPPKQQQQKPKFAPEAEGPLSARRGSDSGPNAFDDMPLTGAGGGGYPDMKHSSGKKVAKVEAVHHPAYDDRIGHDDGNNYEDAYADAKFDDEGDNDDQRIPYTERAIKPKSSTYEEALGGIDDDPNTFKNGGNAPKPSEQFPPGEHPLEDVQNFLQLPSPEALAKKSREVADQYNIINLLGEYRTRCLFSKTWVLREAAITKTQLMLEHEFCRDPAGLGGYLSALTGIIKVGVEDKIQQVQSAAVGLMDEMLLRLKGSKMQRTAVMPLFDGIITQLVEKLADGNARLREGARKGLEFIAASALVGPGAVCSQVTKSLPPKQKTAWRPISARLEVLTDLVVRYGLGRDSGLSVDSVLSFPKNNQAYAHSAEEVRLEAKKLVLAVQRTAGTPAVESTLALLRPKQLEEYKAAFEGGEGRAGPESGSGAPGGAQKKSSAPQQQPPSPARVDRHLQHATHVPGGKVPTSAAKAAGHKHGDDRRDHKSADDEDAPDFTSCMFCGVRDKTWNENDLDVHYWKDCPLLISCPSCAQIVEIAGLPEHLLDECDEKDSYVPCDTTGLAIRSNEINAWKKGPNCVPAPANCMYCPLCLASVEDSDDAWLAHLTKGCPRNTRTNGSS